MTDQKFREQLRYYETAPPDPVWHGIATALHADKRKKRVLWIGRIAAAIAILVAVGTGWLWLREAPETRMARKDTPEEGIFEGTRPDKTSSPETETRIPETVSGLSDTEAELTESLGDVAKRGRETGEAPSGHSLRQPGIPVVDESIPGGQAEMFAREGPHMGNLKPIPSLSADFFQTDLGKPADLMAMHPYPLSLPDESEGIDVSDRLGNESKSGRDKWGVGTQVSPIYSYRSLQVEGGSAASASYYDNVEDGIVSYAGGVNVQYAPLRRLSVQSGLYYSSMGMKVGNAYYASMESKESFLDQTSAIQASINNSTGTIETQQGLDYVYAANNDPQGGWEPTSLSLRANTPVVPTGEILQQFEYLELPLILRYRVVDRRIGFHLLGGLSSNFLIGNSAYYLEAGDKERIGTTADLRPVNYSSVVGLGLDYSISRRFHINLEPTFRYYLNSINTGPLIKSHPYTIGFFTGLLYTF